MQQLTDDTYYIHISYTCYQQALAINRSNILFFSQSEFPHLSVFLFLVYQYLSWDIIHMNFKHTTLSDAKLESYGQLRKYMAKACM